MLVSAAIPSMQRIITSNISVRTAGNFYGINALKLRVLSGEASGLPRTERLAAKKCRDLDGRDVYRKSTGMEASRSSTGNGFASECSTLARMPN